MCMELFYAVCTALYILTFWEQFASIALDQLEWRVLILIIWLAVLLATKTVYGALPTSLASFIENNYFFIPLFIVLNTLDAHSTYLFTKKLGMNAKGNPIARFLFKKTGFWGCMLLHKIPFTILFSMLVVRAPDPTINLAIIIFFMFIVWQNYRLAFKKPWMIKNQN